MRHIEMVPMHFAAWRRRIGRHHHPDPSREEAAMRFRIATCGLLAMAICAGAEVTATAPLRIGDRQQVTGCEVTLRNSADTGVVQAK
jgi:hypothetical protein